MTLRSASAGFAKGCGVTLRSASAGFAKGCGVTLRSASAGFAKGCGVTLRGASAGFANGCGSRSATGSSVDRTAPAACSSIASMGSVGVFSADGGSISGTTCEMRSAREPLGFGTVETGGSTGAAAMAAVVVFGRVGSSSENSGSLGASGAGLASGVLCSSTDGTRGETRGDGSRTGLVAGFALAGTNLVPSKPISGFGVACGCSAEGASGGAIGASSGSSRGINGRFDAGSDSAMAGEGTTAGGETGSTGCGISSTAGLIGSATAGAVAALNSTDGTRAASECGAAGATSTAGASGEGCSGSTAEGSTGIGGNTPSAASSGRLPLSGICSGFGNGAAAAVGSVGATAAGAFFARSSRKVTSPITNSNPTTAPIRMERDGMTGVASIASSAASCLLPGLA